MKTLISLILIALISIGAGCAFNQLLKTATAVSYSMIISDYIDAGNCVPTNLPYIVSELHIIKTNAELNNGSVEKTSLFLALYSLFNNSIGEMNYPEEFKIAFMAMVASIDDESIGNVVLKGDALKYTINILDANINALRIAIQTVETKKGWCQNEVQ